MNLNSLSAAEFKKILGLLQHKEHLEDQVAKIDADLAKFESGEPAAPAKGQPGRKPERSAKGRAGRVKRAARGAVKARILELLKAAGESGITVKEIAAKLGANDNRVFTWFYSTGKAIEAIKQLGPGKYGWATASAPVAKPVAEAKAPTRPARKPKGKQPAVAKERVIGLVKDAGKAGLTVKEIAGKLGVDTQRIYTWFHATGKKVKAIKKVGAAKYAWVG